MTEKIFSGKTVEEALQLGLSELGLERKDVEVEVLEEGKKRLFGSVPAQVKLTVIEKKEKSDGERAVEFLKGLFSILGQTVEPELKQETDKIVIDLKAESVKGLIGRRGEMIDAVQTLAGAVANTGRKEYVRLVVDCENYRDDREATLKHVAEKMAAKAVRLCKRVRLEPMNPYERRIIHAALAESPDVTTKSEGKEPTRYVVIIPKNLKPYERGKGDRDHGRYGKGNRNDRGRGGQNGKPYHMNRSKISGETKSNRELPKENATVSSGTSLNRSGGGYKKGGFTGFFGTYLGNSRDGSESDLESQESQNTEELE